MKTTRGKSSLLAILVLAAAHISQSAVLSQSRDEVTTRFRSDAMAAWDKYVEFSISLQGVVRDTDVTTFHGKDTQSSSNTYYDIRQNRQCVSLTSPFLPDYLYILLSNQKYVAQVRRERDASATTILQDIAMDPVGKLPMVQKPLRDFAFPVHSPHFSYMGLRLKDILNDRSFTVTGVTKEQSEGESLIRVDFIYHLQAGESVNRGFMLLDPQRFWCVRVIDESFEMKRNKSTGHKRTEYEIVRHESGFPILSRATSTTTATSPARGRTSWVHTSTFEFFVRDDVPDEEFRLSHFGLPEPVGVEWPKPRSKLPWILGAAGACLALAMLCFYLKRRHAARKQPAVTS